MEAPGILREATAVTGREFYVNLVHPVLLASGPPEERTSAYQSDRIQYSAIQCMSQLE